MRALLAVLFLTVACDRGHKPPSPPPPPTDEPVIAAEIGLSDSALAIVREVAQGPLSKLYPEDSNGIRLAPRGVSVGLPQRKTKSAIAQLRERLGPGHFVFEAQRGYGMSPDSIGVIAGTDQLDILRVRNTDGINYDITKDSVLALVRLWDQQYGLAITGAALDWFEARILRPPADYAPFANVLYSVCPDIVTQGTNTVDALIAEMRRSHTLYCWWD